MWSLGLACVSEQTELESNSGDAAGWTRVHISWAGFLEDNYFRTSISLSMRSLRTRISPQQTGTQ